MTLEGMRILVTGATGFLGGRAAQHLSKLGASVTATGRNEARLGDLSLQTCKTLAADLSSPDALASISGEYDAIVHCAALSAPWGRPEDFHSANVVATQTVLCIAARNPECRMIHISSSAVYFQPKDQSHIAESDPLPDRLINHYARSKLMSETLVRGCGQSSIILRPRGIYGPGDTALVPRLIAAAEARPLPLLRGGQAKTDLTHVDDVVSAIVASLRVRRPHSGKIYNISGGEALSIKGIIETVCFHAGIDLRWRVLPTSLAMLGAHGSEIASALGGWKSEPLVTRYSLGLLAWSQTLDISKAQHELNWTPKITFEEGLKETLGSLFP